jgi:hypothetical protein
VAGVLRWDARDYRISGGEFVALAVAPTGGRRIRYRLLAEAGDGDPDPAGRRSRSSPVDPHPGGTTPPACSP